MKELEEWLAGGLEVECANLTGGCAGVIKQGDPYVMEGEYMYCCQECADEDIVEEG